MISPPVNIGGDHVNAKTDLVLRSVFSVRSVGGSGVVVITAPLPYSETSELP